MSQRIGTLGSRWDCVGGLLVHARASLGPAPTDSPPVVLVHGLVVSSRYMVPIALLMAPHCRVYAPDLPGFGRSEKPSRVLNVPELADALLGWMETVGLEKPVLLGNSFGCQVIADLASRHPDRVHRAVLVGPTVDPAAHSLPWQAWRWVVDAPREPLSLFPILVRDYLSAGPRRAVGTLRYMLEDHIEEKLPHIQVPTLVVRGARDPIVPRRWSEDAARLLPKGRLVTIPGAPHSVNYSSPLELVRVVRPFLVEGREDVAREEAA